MQTIYLLSNPNGTMKLYEFVIIFGCFMLILAQIPSFHSLRHINLLSLILCLAYSVGATAGSIYIGNFSNQCSSFGNVEIFTLCFYPWNQTILIWNLQSCLRRVIQRTKKGLHFER